MNDTNASIFHSAKRFFSGTILSRITGMLRDMMMAFAFGTGGSVAAFMVAFRFSHLLRRLLGEGALQTAFIPYFEELRADNPERAFRFFRDLYGALSILLFIIITLIIIALGFVLHDEILSPGNHEILYLTLLMMPSLLFICLFGLNASLLQCEKYFFSSSVAPVAFNLIWIVGVLVIWFADIENSMAWLSVAVIIACLSQWLMTLPQTWLIVKKHLDRNFWSGIRLYSKDIAKLLIPLFCGVIGVAASQVNNALDSIFARYADVEGPAFLWYAIRLQQLPLGIFGIAISSALLPPLARAIKNKDRQSYQEFLGFTLSCSVTLMIPITLALFVLGDSCINLIYGHGNFSDLSIQGTTLCLWAYAIGLIPMALVLIYAPAFYADGNYRIPTIASALSVILNIILNTLLIAVWGLGAASVALATSISSWLNLAILAFALSKRMGTLSLSNVYKNCLKAFFASVLAGLAVLAMRQYLWDDTLVFEIIGGGMAIFPHHFLQQFLPLAIEGGIFVGIFGVTLYLCKSEIIQKIHPSLLVD